MTINTNPTRNVSMRDTKAVMYGEIERLRALLEERDAHACMLIESVDRAEERIATQAETIERLQTRVENAKRVYLEQRAQLEERCRCIDCDGDRNEHDPWCPTMRETHGDDTLASDIASIAQRSAILLKRSTRVRDGRVEQYVDGEWTLVPQRVIRYAAS